MFKSILAVLLIYLLIYIVARAALGLLRGAWHFLHTLPQGNADFGLE